MCLAAGGAIITLGKSNSANLWDWPITAWNVRQTIALSEDPNPFAFMEIKLTYQDETHNEKWFLGRLPNIGEAVEMVYVGPSTNGGMVFQLRAKDSVK